MADITYTGGARFGNFSMTMPYSDDAVSIPQQITFNTERTEVDLSQLTENGWLEWVAGVYIDNTANAGYLFFECFGTNQKFYFPPNSSGYCPLLLPNPPKVFITHSSGGDVQFQWYNVPVFPIIFRGPLSDLPNGPILFDKSLAMTGASDTLLTGGEGNHYFIVQNPVGNGTITLNLAGGDAGASGIAIPAGGSYEAPNGITNAITVHGTASQTVNCFAG